MLLVLALCFAFASSVFAQTAPGGQTVSGTVLDATGAVLPRARVTLSTPAQAERQTTTDATGMFRFDGLAPGRYAILVEFEGFRPTTTQVTVGSRPPSKLRITLTLAGVQQEVVVSDRAQVVEPGAASNADAVALDHDLLNGLPVFDRDLVAAASRFLDPAAAGNGGVTLVVDGMEVSALRVSASAVQQIKINQDPYSAEYVRPGRGRIEVLTNPGSAHYQGEANLVWRNAVFDARNAFATEKPEDRKHVLEGMFGGPIGHGRVASFMISASDQLEDQQAIVYAAGPEGPLRDTVPQPTRQSLVSGSLTYRKSDGTTFSIRPSFEYESVSNRGVGGTTLATAGVNFKHVEEQVTYNQQTLFSPTFFMQAQVLVGHEREPTVSVSPDRGIVVQGAFVGGGAQGDLTRTETHLQMVASVGWTKGRHLVRAGFQLPDWSRRGFDDCTNFGGKFYFASLNAYAASRPYSFVQQQGNGNLAFLEKQVGGYLKDDWQVTPGLTLSYGVRYDWQNYFHDTNNVAPRLSIAYAPGKSKKNVFRAGAGVFNDRSGPVAIADLLHSRPGGLVKYVITDPSYPDPFEGATGTTEPPSIVRLSPTVRIPQTLQYSAGMDHQLWKAATLSITYTGAHGFHLFRSRDVNAPLPPLYRDRPDPSFGVIRQIESEGRQQSDSVAVTLRGQMTRWFNGQVQYAVSRTRNDTNGISWFPANDYDLSGEYGRADSDRRHRLAVIGRVTPPRPFVDIGLAITAASGAPYTALLGQDLYNNGRGGARPAGVSRNTLQGTRQVTGDLRVSKNVTLAHRASDPPTLTLGVDVFNLTNRVNYGSYVGTIGSPLFRQPVSARPARQFQFSARVSF